MRDYKKHIWKAFLAIKYSQKHIWKACLLLSVFLVFGISEAHAFDPITVGLVVGGVALVGGIVDFFVGGETGDLLFGRALGNVAEGFINGIASLVNFVVSILGHIFFWVANTTIQFAVDINKLIGQSLIIKDGYSVAQSVVNMGFVLGFVVIAIAIIVRADWLVEVRKTIPKFITAILLVNFGYWIGINLLIAPVDGIFQNIYEAAKINVNTFRGALSPNLDLKSVIGSQMAVSKIGSDNQDFAKMFLNYLRFKEERLGPGIDKMLKEYGSISSNFCESSPIGEEVYTNSQNEPVARYTYVTPHQRAYIQASIFKELDIFLEDMNDPDTFFGYDNTRGQFIDGTWGRGGGRGIEQYFDDQGATFRDCSSAQSNFENLETAIADFISTELAKTYTNLAPALDEPDNNDWGFGCQLWDEDGRPIYGGNSNCYEGENDTYVANLSNVAWQAEKGLSSLEKMIILLIEVLFNAAFTFIGAFTLLGIGLLLIYRYVALSLLMILFPFAWLGWVFPKIATAGGAKNIWNAWWGQFLRWLLFGPVAMFFIYLSARAAINLDTSTVAPGEAFVGMGSMAVLAASVGNAAVVIGLLIGGAQVANKFGIAGSGMIMGGIKAGGKWAGKTAKKYIGKGAASVATAPLRSERGQKMLGKIEQSKLLGDNRWARTLMSPITGTASKAKGLGQTSGRKKVEEEMGQFKDMRSEDIAKKYSSLRTEGQRMAAMRTMLERGHGTKMNLGMRREMAGFEESGKFKKYNQEDTIEKKNKKQGLSAKTFRAIEEVQKHRAGTAEHTAALARVQAAWRDQISGLSSQEVANLTKYTGALFGNYKGGEEMPDGTIVEDPTKIEKRAFGLDGETHKAVREAIVRETVQNRPENISTIRRQMNAEGLHHLTQAIDQEADRMEMEVVGRATGTDVTRDMFDRMVASRPSRESRIGTYKRDPAFRDHQEDLQKLEYLQKQSKNLGVLPDLASVSSP